MTGVTEGYTRKDGQFVPGHDVEILGGIPYGIGQMIMIPICLVLIYLAIVKEFEPLLLLPIGLGGLLANIPFAGITTPEMLGVGKMTAEQIATRRANCGTSDYDVYEKPASQCSPPTARPGQSMHEQGLAVDFVHQGRILTRSSPAFRWLQANAARFGLYNLPSEPWHWSVNAQ